MTKDEMRQYYLKKRSSLSKEDLLSKNKAIKDLLFSRLMVHRYDKVHVYLPVIDRNEVDTRPVISTLLDDFPASVYVPKIQKNGILTHHIFDKYTLLKNNKWGVPEPENEGISSKDFFNTHDDILVIVPLLAYDKKGNRVGYGKGYYDRFLAHKTENTLVVGLSYFEPEEFISDAEDTDVPLNYTFTPGRVWSF